MEMLVWKKMLVCMKASLEFLAVCMCFLDKKEKTREQEDFFSLVLLPLESKTAQPG